MLTGVNGFTLEMCVLAPEDLKGLNIHKVLSKPLTGY